MSAVANQTRSEDHAPGPSPAPFAVSIEHVTKSFRLPRDRVHTLKEYVLHPLRRRQVDILHAVNDVTVQIAQGEFFGIVGRNGSGKSTLLKCLAGIYAADEGELSVEGRLSPFIELGVGFNLDLTARDNVIINAIMLGLTRRQAKERFDDIIAFAELEEFTELKLKNYSSGMLVRLAFATAIQVDADVLLIDEVLAVGDASFQQKCFDEFGRLRQEGRTVLFVTHDMGAVQRFCDRAMLLERGKVVDIGDSGSIARQYNRLNFEGLAAAESAEDVVVPPDARAAKIQAAWFESEQGEVIVTANQGEPCVVVMEVHFIQTIADPVLGITLQNETGNAAFSTSTNMRESATGLFEAGSTATVRVRFENWLAPGHYKLVAYVARAGFGADVFDSDSKSSIIVMAERAGGGLADLPSSIEIEPG